MIPIRFPVTSRGPFLGIRTFGRRIPGRGAQRIQPLGPDGGPLLGVGDTEAFLPGQTQDADLADVLVPLDEPGGLGNLGQRIHLREDRGQPSESDQSVALPLLPGGSLRDCPQCA